MFFLCLLLVNNLDITLNGIILKIYGTKFENNGTYFKMIPLIYRCTIFNVFPTVSIEKIDRIL